MEGRVIRKFSKKSKKFQNSKNAQIRSQKCPNVFWRCFRVFFSKKFFAQCSMEGRVFENFQKNQNIFKVQKCPKSSPKVSKRKFSKKSNKFQNSKNAQNRPQKSPNVFWRCFMVIFSEIFFCPVFHGGSSLRKFWKKIKKVSKFQKCPKSSPKVSKRKFSKKIKKVSKFQKRPKSFQKCPNVFWTCFGGIFSKKFFAQCSKEGRVIENFQKNQKIFKIPKMPKIVPKSVQTCFEDVLGWFFWKFFLPSVPWRVESSNFFEKIKKFSKFKKCPNSFPKVSKRVLKMF